MRFIPTFFLFFYALTASAEVVKIPLKFTSANIPVVQLDVGGKRINAMLDIGAHGALYLPEYFIASLSQRDDGSAIIKSIDVEGRKYENKTHFVPQVHLGGMLFPNVDIINYEPWGSNSGKKLHEIKDYQAVIGIDFFRDCQIVIDYAARQLIISNSNETLINENDGWHTLPGYFNGHLVIEMDYGDNVYNMALDTGANPSFLYLSNDSEIKIYDCSKKYGSGCRMTYLPLPYILGGNMECILNNREILSYDGLLGYNFIKNYKIYINFPKRTFFLKTYK